MIVYWNFINKVITILIIYFYSARKLDEKISSTKLTFLLNHGVVNTSITSNRFKILCSKRFLVHWDVLYSIFWTLRISYNLCSAVSLEDIFYIISILVAGYCSMYINHAQLLDFWFLSVIITWEYISLFSDSVSLVPAVWKECGGCDRPGDDHDGA